MSAYLLAAANGVPAPSSTPPPMAPFTIGPVTLTAVGTGAVIADALANHPTAVGQPGANNRLVIDYGGSTVTTGATFAPGRSGWKIGDSFPVVNFMSVGALTGYTHGDTFFARVREVRDDYVQRVIVVARLTVP